ncbi:hypothetical protein [Streptomyces sp. NPDC056525]|uniref:hypothetical protein n=1 Tax=unclassified Streptomyces TaxID=2593676 RepID=UPI0036966484
MSRGSSRYPGATAKPLPPGRESDAATLAAALPAVRRQVVPGPDAYLDVTVGTRPVHVKKVTYDRNVIDGAPTTADRLGCLADSLRNTQARTANR